MKTGFMKLLSKDAALVDDLRSKLLATEGQLVLEERKSERLENSLMESKSQAENILKENEDLRKETERLNQENQQLSRKIEETSKSNLGETPPSPNAEPQGIYSRIALENETDLEQTVFCTNPPPVNDQLDEDPETQPGSWDPINSLQIKTRLSNKVVRMLDFSSDPVFQVNILIALVWFYASFLTIFN